MKDAWLMPEMHAEVMAVRIVKMVKLGAKAVDTLEAKQISGTNVNKALRPYLKKICLQSLDH